MTARTLRLSALAAALALSGSYATPQVTDSRQRSLVVAPDASASPRAAAGQRTVARVWRGRVRPAKADEYEAYLNASGVAMILGTPGNRGVIVLRRAEKTYTEFVVTSFWQSLEAVQGFAGKDYQKAVILPRDRDYLISVEPRVLHYEVVRRERR